MKKIEFRMSLKIKIVISFLLVSVIPTLTVSWLLYTQSAKYLKENLFSYLEGISEMKKQALVMQVRDRKDQIKTGAQSPSVLILMSRMRDEAEESKGVAVSELRERLEKILADGDDFEEIYVIDAAGKILISTKKDSEGKDVKDMEYFTQGSRETYFQSIFLSPVTGKLSLVAASPIKNRDGTLLGILAGRINIDEFFRIIKDVTGLGDTGETLVATKKGDEAVFLMPTRHDPNSALNIKIKFGDARSIPVQKAVQGVEGNGVFKDYRGKMVMASWQYIPDIKWGMVTKIDREEFEKPMKKFRGYIFFLTFVIVVVVCVTAYIFAIRIVRPINRLTSVAERVSKGELDIKIDIESKDEIGNLARSFERMLAAIKIFKEDKE